LISLNTHSLNQHKEQETMKLTNTTRWPDRFLRRLISWCCRELELPVRQIIGARFGKRRGGRWSGRAFGTRRILVRIGDAVTYPTASVYTQQHGAVVFTADDPHELLIKITAHELAHCKYPPRSSRRGYEQSIDAHAFHVLRAFREQRAELLALWNAGSVATAPAGAVESAAARQAVAKRKPHIVTKRAAKAAADLARWERKFKLAKTKLRKLRARVKYYESKTAATRSVASVEMERDLKKLAERGAAGAISADEQDRQRRAILETRQPPVLQIVDADE
jgi:hypothetical protein